MNERKKKRNTNKSAYSPLGRSLILVGAAVMLICAIWECAVRLDSMDGAYQWGFNLARKANIPLTVALQELFNTDEAMRDLSVVIYIAATGLFSVLAAVFRKKTAACVLMAPVCVYILINGTGSTSVLQALNLFRPVRALCAALMLVGACLNVAYSIYAKSKSKKRKQAHERENSESHERQPSHGTYKTLIPRRETVQRSRSVGRNG